MCLEAAKAVDILPIKPTFPEQTVFTHFWVDNFDLKVDRIGGGGSINTTHLMAFQEKQLDFIPEISTIRVKRRKTRVLFYEAVDVYKNPEKTTSSIYAYNQERETDFNKLHVIWLYIRKQNHFNQCVPVIKGWLLSQRQESSVMLKKTSETFFPPITSKVTEFSTIQKYSKDWQQALICAMLMSPSM